MHETDRVRSVEGDLVLATSRLCVISAAPQLCSTSSVGAKLQHAIFFAVLGLSVRVRRWYLLPHFQVNASAFDRNTRLLRAFVIEIDLTPFLSMEGLP